MGRPLPRRFFARDADVVARDLLGRLLVHESPAGRRACRIVETEAYFGPPDRNAHLARRRDLPPALLAHLAKRGDAASHSARGITQRNRVMWGPPGFFYVYLIYGMHECANVVTGPEDEPEPQAVLLRAGEPVEGLDAMRAARGVADPRALASGPAKLAKAMGMGRAHYGVDATKGALHFEAGRLVKEADVTPRIGVVGAEWLPLRYLARGSPFVSRPAR